jgi:hypothetical protein
MHPNRKHTRTCVIRAVLVLIPGGPGLGQSNVCLHAPCFVLMQVGLCLLFGNHEAVPPLAFSLLLSPGSPSV